MDVFLLVIYCYKVANKWYKRVNFTNFQGGIFWAKTDLMPLSCILPKNKIYTFITSLTKNMYIDKLVDILIKCYNTYHTTIKMKPTDVKCMTYLLWCRKQSLLNYLPYVPLYPTCLVLYVPSCFTHLGPHVLSCLVPFVLSCFACLVFYMLSCFIYLVLTCSSVNRYYTQPLSWKVITIAFFIRI